MPRRPFPSDSLAAAVRAHFGLSQAELAAFVGISRPQLALVEAGRKNLGPGPDQRLQVLARQLPPPDGHGPPAPTFDNDSGGNDNNANNNADNNAPRAAVEAPAAAETEADALSPLHQRLARCHWLRTLLTHELSTRHQPGQARHQRRQWAVQVLGPALATPLPVPDWLAPGGPALPLPPYPLATPDAARDTHWLSGLVLHLAATVAPLSPVARALAMARIAGFDAEILSLTTALGEAGLPRR